jgi:hypothetical protein
MAHRRSLGFPGFPVEGCGFEQLHVVLFEENHISGTGESCEAGNPGTLGMTKRRGLLKGRGLLSRGKAIVVAAGMPFPWTYRPLHRQQPFLCESKKVTGSQDDGFVGGLKYSLVGFAENTKRSTKS